MAELVPKLLAVTLDLSIALMVVGIGLCLIRLLRGPHAADRALAADTIALQLVALVVLFSIERSTLIYFDGVLTLSLVGFATTVAAGQFIVRRGRRSRSADGDGDEAALSEPRPPVRLDAPPKGGA